MIAGKKTANAVGGKTARACDNCVRKRARWYCAADDAFLCQNCDASVHLDSKLGGQHERVLLQTASSKLVGYGDQPEPTWHHGFTRRARTPRQRAKYSAKIEEKNNTVNSSVHLVPVSSLEVSLFDDEEEVEQQVMYRVPIFDPFETEICNQFDDIHGFGQSINDLELLEFGADVESLLGKEFDDTSCRIEEDDAKNRVKVEDEEVEAILGFDLDASKETLDWDFDCESLMMIKEEEKKVVVGVEREHMTRTLNDQCNEGKVRTSSMVLRLNYEDVINTWADQGSPWTNGTRPELNPNGYWPDLMGAQWAGNNNPSHGGVGRSDGGREARVSRYREKRRSRLFSKKIRYEVRKLNAEKRPRMKGRFVKRETFQEPPKY